MNFIRTIFNLAICLSSFSFSKCPVSGVHSKDYIPRLLEYVTSLDYAIQDRKQGLEALRQCVGKPTDDPIKLWGPAEALASFEGAKRRLFEIFPELKEHYKGIEDKL